MTVPSWWPDAFQPTCRPSSTATLAPGRAASSATVRPASPAPITQISASRSNESRERSGIAAASGRVVALGGVSLMAFSYGPIGRLSPCSGPKVCTLIRGTCRKTETNRDCTMRRLMLLRHAKTESDAPSGRDRDRRLDDRGRRDAAEIGGFIAGHPPFPGTVLVSPATRAHQTWELAWAAMKELMPPPQVELLPELYGADPAQLLQTIHAACATDPKRLMIVG